MGVSLRQPIGRFFRHSGPVLAGILVLGLGIAVGVRRAATPRLAVTPKLVVAKAKRHFSIDPRDAKVLFDSPTLAAGTHSQDPEAIAMREFDALRKKTRDVSANKRINAKHWLEAFGDFIDSHEGTQAAAYARVSAAWRLHELKRDEEAMSEFNTAMGEAKGGNRARLLGEKCDYLREIGQPEQAIALLEPAVREFAWTPDCAYCRISLAWAYSSIGRTDLAKATCDELAKDAGVGKRHQAEAKFNSIVIDVALLHRSWKVNAQGEEIALSIQDGNALLGQIKQDLVNFQSQTRRELLASIETHNGVTAQDGSLDDMADLAAYELGVVLFETEQYVDAQAQFQSIVDSTSDHDMLNLAQVGVSASLCREGNLADAVTIGQLVIDDPLTSAPTVEDATIWRNTAQGRLGMVAPPAPPPDDSSPQPANLTIEPAKRSIYR